MVKPETLNRALQINSEAIRFETERPIIELKSPYIEAAFWYMPSQIKQLIEVLISTWIPRRTASEELLCFNSYWPWLPLTSPSLCCRAALFPTVILVLVCFWQWFALLLHAAVVVRWWFRWGRTLFWRYFPSFCWLPTLKFSIVTSLRSQFWPSLQTR